MNLIELQPDDVLVLRCPGAMTQAERKTLADEMTVLGAGREVLILDAGYTLDVIRVAVSGKVETNDIVRPTSSWTVDGKPIVPTVHYDGSPFNEIGQREVQHVDTDEPEPAGIPPHVWLYRNMLTDLQALAPLGRDETNGQYAVAIDQLTSEQTQVPHIRDQLLAMAGAETRRLDAQLDEIIAAEKLQADNKPT